MLIVSAPVLPVSAAPKVSVPLPVTWKTPHTDTTALCPEA